MIALVAAGESDEELARRAAKDESALQELHQRHSEKVVRWLQVLSLDKAAAEDAAQVVWLTLWTGGLASFRPGGNFIAFLYTITVNKGKDELRRRTRKRERPLEAANVPPARDDTVGSAKCEEDLRIALECFDRLPEQDRIILVMIYHHEMTYDEISRVTGEKIGTLKSRKSRAVGRYGGLLAERTRRKAQE